MGVDMVCVIDTNFDRMRIIAPITPSAGLDPTVLDALLEANFHSALDARYATSNGYVYSAFIHPLSPLTEKELISALRQVATLALTFGTEYTSGELSFGQPATAQDDEEGPAN